MIALSGLALAGCIPRASSNELPSWMLLTEPRDARGLRMSVHASTLVRELHEGYTTGHTSPEELATLAIEQLEQRHPWDASVLLAWASYRRHEQAQYFVTDGARQRADAIHASEPYADPYRVDKLVDDIGKQEAEAYLGSLFDDELARVAALVGAPLSAEAQRDDFLRILVGGLGSRHLAAQALTRRVETLRTPPAPRLVYPAVAAALRQRLVNDAQQPTMHLAAVRYLAAVPLPSFRAAALREVRVPFSGIVVRTGAWLYRRDPEAVVRVLQLGLPPARLHAAIVLGLSDDLTKVDVLEEALSHEHVDTVAQALRFALVRLGEHQHLGRLAQVPEDLPDMETVAAVALLQWLPLDLKLELDPGQLANVIWRAHDVPVTQFLAAITLVDIGTKRALDHDAFRAIGQVLSTLRQDETNAQAIDLLIDHVGGLSQLSRGFILKQLERSHHGTQVWLSLLRRHAQEQDLVALDRLLREREDSSVRAWVLRVAAVIEGERAQAQLERWYAEYESLRTMISVLLVLREGTDKRRLHALLDDVGDSPSTSMLQLALARPGAEQRVRDYLASDEPAKRYEATLAVRFLSGKQFDAELWGNASYFAGEHYPGDVLVRTSALSTLLHARLSRSYDVSTTEGELVPTPSEDPQDEGSARSTAKVDGSLSSDNAPEDVSAKAAMGEPEHTHPPRCRDATSPTCRDNPVKPENDLDSSLRNGFRLPPPPRTLRRTPRTQPAPPPPPLPSERPRRDDLDEFLR